MTKDLRRPVHDADEVLRLYWGGSNGNIAFPVDPVKIATRMNADVFVENLDEGESGQTTRKTGGHPVMILNAKDSFKRRRFTCAREVGRLYVTRYEPHGLNIRGNKSTEEIDPEESYANKFASALLMPAEHVRKLHRDGLPIAHLALRFGVSETAMRFRIENLGLVSD